MQAVDFMAGRSFGEAQGMGSHSHSHPHRSENWNGGLHVTGAGARREAGCAHTDIFSFGLVLYEAVAGQRAFAGETAPVLHAAILNDIPKPLRDLNPDIPSALERIITKALQKDRELRYQSASAVSIDLKVQAELLRQRNKASSSKLWRLATAVVAAVLLATGVGVWTRSSRLVLPELRQMQLTNNSNENAISGGSISPDGSQTPPAERVA